MFVPSTAVAMFVSETRLLGTGQVFATEARIRCVGSSLSTADQSLPAVPR